MKPGKAIVARIALAGAVGLAALAGSASPALAVTATAKPPGAAEGRPATGTVATFTDGVFGLFGCTPDAQYTASVTWGDGTTGPATVTGGVGILIGGCLYAVEANHTYAEEGPFDYSVSIAGPSGTGSTGPARVVVVDAPLSASAAGFNATQGTPSPATVASFTDANPGAQASDFTATISFGDGTSGAGSVAAAAAGGFDVTATHTYVHSGDYAVATTIKDTGGAQAAASTTAAVLTTTNPPTTKPPVTATPGPLRLKLSTPALARGGTVVIGVRCPVAARQCRGRLNVSTVAAPRSPIAALRRAVPLGTTLFIIPGGNRGQLSVRPKRALVAQLRAAGSVLVALQASSFDATGHSQVATLTAKLRIG